VLKTTNAAYQKFKAGVIYSNFYWYNQGSQVMLGFTSEYTQDDKANNRYRDTTQRFSHMRTFRVELFRKIDPEVSFIDPTTGKFFTITADFAAFFPVMELACGRVYKMDGYHYLYNVGTGLNDYMLDRNRQVAADRAIRGQPKYNCSSKFEARMKALEQP
jgi:hypothetical protein